MVWRDILCLVLGVVIIVFGILTATGWLLPHLSSWKAIDAKEKEKIRVAPLCHNIGAMMGVAGVIFILYALITPYTQTAFTLTIGAWFVVAIVDIVYIAKSKRYRNEM